MVEATKQAENTAKSWAENQIKIYDRWFQTFQSTGAPKALQGWEQMRRNTLDSWEASVKGSLQAQAELARIVVDTLGTWGPAQDQNGRGAVVGQLREMVKSWTDAQEQVWSSWFDVAKKLDVSSLAESWDKLLEATQQTARKAWETHARWVTPETNPNEAKGSK
jgi:hypothetical protein